MFFYIVYFIFVNFETVFVQVHQETFGKSGCRRIVPGQYLAVDPKGRAIMIGKSVLYVPYATHSWCGNSGVHSS